MENWEYKLEYTLYVAGRIIAFIPRALYIEWQETNKAIKRRKIELKERVEYIEVPEQGWNGRRPRK